MGTLDCQEPSQYQTLIVPLLVQLRKRENYNEKEQTFNVQLHGSLILQVWPSLTVFLMKEFRELIFLQELLCFSKPIKLVNSLLSLDSNKLRNLFSDPKGSHLADVFMKSPSIGEKSRDSLVKSLQVGKRLLLRIYQKFKDVLLGPTRCFGLFKVWCPSCRCTMDTLLSEI